MTAHPPCAAVEWAHLTEQKLAVPVRHGISPAEDVLADAIASSHASALSFITTTLGPRLTASCVAALPAPAVERCPPHQVASPDALERWRRRARSAAAAVAVVAPGSDGSPTPTVMSHQVSVIDWAAVDRSGVSYEIRHLSVFDREIEQLTTALARVTGNPWSAVAFVGSALAPTPMPPPAAWTLVVPIAGSLSTQATETSGEAEIEVGAAALVGPDARVTASEGAIVVHFRTTWPSLSEVVAHARQVARFWPRFRADLPYDLAEPAHSYAGSVYDEPGDLRREIDQLLDADVVARFRAQRLLDLGTGVPGVGLASQDPSPTDHGWRYRPIGPPVVLDRSETAFTLGAAGQGITLPRHAIPALARVIARDGAALGDLGCPHLDPSCDTAIRHGLQACGFLEPWIDHHPS